MAMAPGGVARGPFSFALESYGFLIDGAPVRSRGTPVGLFPVAHCLAAGLEGPNDGNTETVESGVLKIPTFLVEAESMGSMTPGRSAGCSD